MQKNFQNSLHIVFKHQIALIEQIERLSHSSAEQRQQFACFIGNIHNSNFQINIPFPFLSLQGRI